MTTKSPQNLFSLELGYQTFIFEYFQTFLISFGRQESKIPRKRPPESDNPGFRFLETSLVNTCVNIRKILHCFKALMYAISCYNIRAYQKVGSRILTGTICIHINIYVFTYLYTYLPYISCVVHIYIHIY